MISFLSTILVASTFVGVFCLPSHLSKRVGTPGGSGINNGYFYAFSTDELAAVTYINDAAGGYQIEWVGTGHFFGGKGWNPGSAR